MDLGFARVPGSPILVQGLDLKFQGLIRRPHDELKTKGLFFSKKTAEADPPPSRRA